MNDMWAIVTLTLYCLIGVFWVGILCGYTEKEKNVIDCIACAIWPITTVMLIVVTIFEIGKQVGINIRDEREKK